MEEYTQRGKKFTLVCLSMKFKVFIYEYDVKCFTDLSISYLFPFFFFLSVSSCLTIIVLLTWTSFLFIYDILVPLNGSHRLECPFVAEYFIDEEVYYYYILLHMYTIFLVGLTVVIATEAFYAICVQHACGLFHIVG